MVCWTISAAGAWFGRHGAYFCGPKTRSVRGSVATVRTLLLRKRGRCVLFHAPWPVFGHKSTHRRPKSTHRLGQRGWATTHRRRRSTHRGPFWTQKVRTVAAKYAPWPFLDAKTTHRRRRSTHRRRRTTHRRPKSTHREIAHCPKYPSAQALSRAPAQADVLRTSSRSNPKGDQRERGAA